jgi:hypothetical protein
MTVHRLSSSEVQVAGSFAKRVDSAGYIISDAWFRSRLLNDCPDPKARGGGRQTHTLPGSNVSDLLMISFATSHLLESAPRS